jgi:2-hydroxychromene-2-carboxylate isomerase
MPILIEQGLSQGPFLPYPNKPQYMWWDLERRAKRYGIAYQKPSHYPPNTLLTARIGYLAEKEGWCAAFTQEVLRIHWAEGVLIGTDDNLRLSLRAISQDLDRVVEAAQSESIKLGLRRQTERAKELCEYARFARATRSVATVAYIAFPLGCSR